MTNLRERLLESWEGTPIGSRLSLRELQEAADDVMAVLNEERPPSAVALLRRYVDDEGLCDNEIARLTSDLPAGSCRADALCFYCTAKAFLAADGSGSGSAREVNE